MVPNLGLVTMKGGSCVATAAPFSLTGQASSSPVSASAWQPGHFLLHTSICVRTGSQMPASTSDSISAGA